MNSVAGKNRLTLLPAAQAQTRWEDHAPAARRGTLSHPTVASALRIPRRRRCCQNVARRGCARSEPRPDKRRAKAGGSVFRFAGKAAFFGGGEIEETEIARFFHFVDVRRRQGEDGNVGLPNFDRAFRGAERIGSAQKIK